MTNHKTSEEQPIIRQMILPIIGLGALFWGGELAISALERHNGITPSIDRVVFADFNDTVDGVLSMGSTTDLELYATDMKHALERAGYVVTKDSKDFPMGERRELTNVYNARLENELQRNLATR